MLKKILRAVGFMTGLAIILAVTSIVLKPKSDVYNAVGVDKKTKDFQKEAEQSLDLVFLGDSESYSAFNPLQMYSEQGYTSYVCGTSLQRLCDTYVLLQESFKTQSPKVVVLETNCFFRFSGLAEDDSDKVMNTFSRVVPVLKYHDRWKTFVPLKIFRHIDKNEGLLKGFRYRTGTEPYNGGEWMKKTEEVAGTGANAEHYLKKIKELVEANGGTLLLVSVPSPDNWTYAKHNAIEKISEEYDLEFLDMNLTQDELNIDWKTETKDGGNHLNFLGAKKVSSYLAKYLSEKYNLPDHREDPAYDNWEEDIKESGMDI